MATAAAGNTTVKSPTISTAGASKGITILPNSGKPRCVICRLVSLVIAVMMFNCYEGMMLLERRVSNIPLAPIQQDLGSY